MGEGRRPVPVLAWELLGNGAYVYRLPYGLGTALVSSGSRQWWWAFQNRTRFDFPTPEAAMLACEASLRYELNPLSVLWSGRRRAALAAAPGEG